ncbi:metallo-beta-lactamase family protein [Hyaloraphidium curvatum]|nr:metallo-beta-lactamase family protein [Hyaloraphidium curvatum]
MAADGVSDLAYETFPVGPLQCNCLLVYSKSTRRAVVIDAGGDADVIVRELRSRNLTPDAVLATHGHLDHILAAAEVKRAFPGCKTAIGKDDRFLWDALAEQARLFGLPMEESQIPGPPDVEIAGDADVLLGDGTAIGRALHTPGHSPGSTCYHFPSISLLASGDTLFQQSVGRTDLWGSDFEQMSESIRTRLYTLPGQTWVIPGHGGKTKIHLEAKWNPFVRADDPDSIDGNSKLSPLEHAAALLHGTVRAPRPHACRGCDALASWREAPPRM